MEDLSANSNTFYSYGIDWNCISCCIGTGWYETNEPSHWNYFL